MPVRNKYGAEPTVYKGKKYPSKLEAAVAQQLDLLRSAANPDERVFECYEQIPFVLVDKSSAGRAVTYVADFVVRLGEYEHERCLVIEAKGKETPVWRLKCRLFHEKYPDADLRVVKKPEEVIAIAQERTKHAASPNKLGR